MDLELDRPQHVLHVVQWPSARVAAARTALEACDAQHARVGKGHAKQQEASRRLAAALEALAEGLALLLDDGREGAWASCA